MTNFSETRKNVILFLSYYLTMVYVLLVGVLFIGYKGGLKIMARANRGRANEDLRLEVFKSGLTYREIARKMGISFDWLSRAMSKKLTPEMRRRITEAIEKLSVTDNEE